MYTYIMLILVNRSLLNLICSMTKAGNGRNSPEQNFHPPYSDALWKTLLQLLLVFLFTPSLFHFKL